LLEAACTIHIHWVYRRLREFAAGSSDDLFAQVLALPKAHQKRLLLAPRTTHLFNGSGLEQQANLRAIVRAEQYIAKQISSPPKCTWTALDDMYFAETNTDCDHATSVNNIVVDVASPHHNDIMDQSRGSLIAYTREDVPSIVRKLSEATDCLYRTNRVAWNCLRSTVQVIGVARSADERLTMTGSCSNRSHIGKLGLINLHLIKYSQAMLLSALVHESIHSLIYKLELLHDLYTDHQLAKTARLTSPWSGRDLPLHSYVHACFVWYGLWHFWNARDGDPEAAYWKTMASKGFRHGSPLKGIAAETKQGIREDILSLIGRLANNVSV
jgi:HEXXH motif-containing protein